MFGGIKSVLGCLGETCSTWLSHFFILKWEAVRECGVGSVRSGASSMSPSHQISQGLGESRTPPRRTQSRTSSDGCYLLFARKGATCVGGLLDGPHWRILPECCPGDEPFLRPALAPGHAQPGLGDSVCLAGHPPPNPQFLGHVAGTRPRPRPLPPIIGSWSLS